MEKIVFKVALTAPVPTTDFLDKEVGKWVKRTKSSATKRKRGLKQAIKTPEDYDRKIHQTRVNTMKAMFKDDIVTRRGLTKADMITKAESKPQKDDECKKYFRTREESFKDKSFEKGVEDRKRMYEKGRIKHFLLYGSEEKNVKGLISLGVMALCGDKSLKKFVDLRSGQPVCIASAEKLGEFKRELRSQIAHLGGEIIKSGYDWEMAKYNSEKLNRLVDGYRRAEFAPFSAKGGSASGGKPGAASHIDFIVVEIPDPARPAASGEPRPSGRGEKKKWLGLEIQVSYASS